MMILQLTDNDTTTIITLGDIIDNSNKSLLKHYTYQQLFHKWQMILQLLIQYKKLKSQQQRHYLSITPINAGNTNSNHLHYRNQ